MVRLVTILTIAAIVLSGSMPAPAQEASEPNEAAAPAADVQEWKQITDTVTGGDCAKALPMLDAYVGSNPDAANAFYFLGYCNGVQGKDDAALAALDRALEIKPDFSGVSVMRGKILARKGRSAEAEQAFVDEIGRSEAPELRIEAWTALAALHGQAKKDDEAKEAWRKVIELAPDRADAYAEIAAIDLRAGRLEEADAILEQGDAAGASNPTARLNVGIAYFNRKDTKRAEEVFQKVCENGPTPKARAAAFGLLAKAQLRDAKKAEAAESIRRSLEIDPSGAMAAELRDMLKTIEKPPRAKK